MRHSGRPAENIPVWRRTSTNAHAQKASLSWRVRSVRVPPPDGQAQIVTILAACEHLRDRFLLSLLAETGIFSAGRPLWRKSDLRVCAAQRLIEER